MKKKIDWSSGINATVTFVVMLPFIIVGILLIINVFLQLFDLY